MARGLIVTSDMVESVKAASAKFPTATTKEIGLLCGTSGTTVGRIMRGEYDYLAERGSGGELTAVLEALDAIKVELEGQTAALNMVLEVLMEVLPNGGEERKAPDK